MTRGQRKALVAVLSSAAAVAVGLPLFLSTPGEPHLPPGPAPAAHAVIDEEFVRSFWGERKGFRYDPVAYLMKEPDQSRTMNWREHPRGEFTLTVNEHGFHEDEPTPAEFDGTRILLAGDSHTAVIENEHSFPNLAESALRARFPGQRLEVVNAGVADTGPFCYLGMLRRCLELGPEVFVATIFVGNDFMDDLRLAYQLGRRQPPEVPESYREKARDAEERWTGPFYQGLNQAYRFKSFPGEAEVARELVLESVLGMQEVCRENGLDLFLVLVPTKMDIDRDDRETWLAACEALGLEERDVAVNLQLGQRVLAAAREHGIAGLDPSAEMRRASVPMYWKQDYHLGYDGHALLGSLMAAGLGEILERRLSGLR